MNKLVADLEAVMKTIRKEFGELSISRLGEKTDAAVEAI